MGRYFPLLCLFLALHFPAAAEQWAVTNSSTAFMRTSPDYTSGLDNQLLMGSVVKILSSDRYWVWVEAAEPSYKGWVNREQLSLIDDVDAYIAAPKWICVSEYSHIYADPERSERISDFILHNLVRKTSERRGDMLKVILPSGRSGWIRKADVEDFGKWASRRSARVSAKASGGAVLVEFARLFRGVPYMWGGTSVKGFDCSGLIRAVYFNFGILLPRDASQMVKTGLELPLDMREWRPGDLLFFGRAATEDSPVMVNHVALYIGEGRIIHSSQVVKENSLLDGSPDRYSRDPVAARRILGHTDAGEGVGRIRSCKYYFSENQYDRYENK